MKTRYHPLVPPGTVLDLSGRPGKKHKRESKMAELERRIYRLEAKMSREFSSDSPADAVKST